ncbi:flagellar motor switch protein FliG [Roseivivax isoporae]|uniref:Flagellar motor switch protein FliG n=1 Tax=Roseivivax isoporae LMG 25204 TaxID=1449351 RepID=X7FCN2_9RHOB|nr:FliG C-terminal domain-containing protein [Roseivivax isoporae]ETX30657.1 flagellar motor switch protein FliG [Roseivivax isoporae LMG 25204]
MSAPVPFAALPGPGLPASRRSGPGGLSRRAKAAIVVQFILNEGADVPLSSLPDDLQEQLTHELGAMRYVDRATLNAVIREFADELDAVGLSFPGGIAGALDLLEGKISPHTARRLRKEAGVRQMGDPWTCINAQTVDRLERFVLSESTEIAAVLLSKIEVGKAAQVLNRLPGPKARRIAYAMSQTAGVTPDTVDRIGLSLAAQIDAEPARAFTNAPPERVGAILNYSSDRTRDDVLEGLDETDRPFAEAVRRAIFTFAHIPARISPADVPRIVREIDNGALVTALAAAKSDELRPAADFLLANMSKRVAAALGEEAADRGEVKPRDAEAAFRTVIDRIRAMVASGEVTLVEPEEA